MNVQIKRTIFTLLLILGIAVLTALVVCFYSFEKHNPRVLIGENIDQARPRHPDDSHAKRNTKIMIRQAPEVSSEGNLSGGPRDSILQIAKTNLNDAIRRAEALEDENMRGNLLGEIAGIWAKTDAEACFAWAQTLRNPNEKSSALVGMSLSMINDGKSDDAIKMMCSMPNGEFKDDMIVYGLTGIGMENINKAVLLSSELTSMGALKMAGSIISKQLIADSRLDEAKLILTGMPEGALRESVNVAMVDRLSRKDPETAFAWFKDNPGFSDRQSLNILASAFARDDPLRGLELADSITSTKERQNYLSTLGMAWGQRSPSESADWVLKQIQDGKYSENLGICEGIISEAIQWQPADIFQKINALQDQQARTSATLGAAKALAKFDPKASAEIVESLSNQQDNGRIAAITEIASNWLQRDPIAASKWVRTLSPGPEKDSAVSALIVNILANEKDTDMARNWAAQIGSLNQRNLALARIEELERNK